MRMGATSIPMPPAGPGSASVVSVDRRRSGIRGAGCAMYRYAGRLSVPGAGLPVLPGPIHGTDDVSAGPLARISRRTGRATAQPSGRRAGSPGRRGQRASSGMLATMTNRWSPRAATPVARTSGAPPPSRSEAAAPDASSSDVMRPFHASKRAADAQERQRVLGEDRERSAGARGDEVDTTRVPGRGRGPRPARPAPSTLRRPSASAKDRRAVCLLAHRVDQRPVHVGPRQREHDARHAASRPEVERRAGRARRAAAARRAQSSRWRRATSAGSTMRVRLSRALASSRSAT